MGAKGRSEVMTRLDKAIKEVRELRESDEKLYQEEQERKNTKLICVEHDEKLKRVSIVFAKFSENNKFGGNKLIHFEEAILEDHEFYNLVEKILVKWGEKKVIK